MDYTGNGTQNWFLKEIEIFIYYVERPLRGLLKEIPKNHLFSPWIGNICLCIAYDIAFTVETIRLKIIVNRLPNFDLTYLQQTLFLIISTIG